MHSSSLRVAVLSDTHGNAYALEAVLVAIRAASPDLIVNLGDQIEGAADPARAYAMQAELGALEVRGNNEEKLWPGGRRSALSQRYGEWLEAQMPPDALSRLAALPLTLRCGDLLLCHGTPTSTWESLLWVWDAQGFYRSRDPRHLLSMVEPLGAAVVLCGHTHRPGATRVADALVVNAGSVSDQVDGDPRARWTLLGRRAGHWSAEFRAETYDIAGAVSWARDHSDFGDGEAELLRSGEMTLRGDSGGSAAE